MSSIDLRGISAVVAGGAGGLGSATVSRLVERGAQVVILDVDRARAEALATGLGNNAEVVVGDSSDDEVVRSAVDAARGRGRFAVAVSATGVVIPSRPLVSKRGEMLSKEALVANFELHVLGPFNLARFSAAAFAENDPDEDAERGVIVQTSSISAFDGQMSMVPYAAAKGAIASMILPMARDLAPLGVRVMAIAPGAIATPRLSSPQVQDLLVRDVLHPKRVGRADEYASLVEHIVVNRYLNGQVIRLDGGARLPPRMG